MQPRIEDEQTLYTCPYLYQPGVSLTALCKYAYRFYRSCVWTQITAILRNERDMVGRLVGSFLDFDVRTACIRCLNFRVCTSGTEKLTIIMQERAVTSNPVTRSELFFPPLVWKTTSHTSGSQRAQLEKDGVSQKLTVLQLVDRVLISYLPVICVFEYTSCRENPDHGALPLKSCTFYTYRESDYKEYHRAWITELAATAFDLEFGLAAGSTTSAELKMYHATVKHDKISNHEACTIGKKTEDVFSPATNDFYRVLLATSTAAKIVRGTCDAYGTKDRNPGDCSVASVPVDCTTALRKLRLSTMHFHMIRLLFLLTFLSKNGTDFDLLLCEKNLLDHFAYHSGYV